MHNMFVYLLAVLLLSVSTAGETSSKRVEADLASISERGILLAGYDAAASHATDAIMALHPPEGTVNRYIARKSPRGWIVAFGRLNPTKDKFLVAYEAIQTEIPFRFEIRKYEPFRQDDGFNLAAVRGAETALKAFRGVEHPYNIAVLPAKPQGLFVYIYPAQVKAGVYPFGADVRFRMSADGTAIIAMRQLHKTLIESIPGDSPGKFAGGYHVHILSDQPEDTDVLLVLSRKPRTPESVVAGSHLFRISENGLISVAALPRSR